MVIETERAESTAHAIQAVHIAFTLVGISVQLALNEEALSEQRFQPWRPPVVLFIRTSSALFSKTKRNPVFQLDPNIKNHSNSNRFGWKRRAAITRWTRPETSNYQVYLLPR